MSTQSTEQRIAAALAARAGGITMDTTTIEQRYTELRARGSARRGGWRRGAAVAAGLAVAAASAAALTIGGVPFRDDDRVVPAAPSPRVLVGNGTLAPGVTYAVEKLGPRFTFAVTDPGDVPNPWTYVLSDTFELELPGSAVLEVFAPERVYDPARPWAEQTELVAAPVDVAGWVDWLETTGSVTVMERTDVEVGGVPGTRLTVDIGALPPGTAGCASSSDPCLAVQPLTSSVFSGVDLGRVGAGEQAGFEPGPAEITVVELEDRAVLFLGTGLREGDDSWRPLTRAVLDTVTLG